MVLDLVLICQKACMPLQNAKISLGILTAPCVHGRTQLSPIARYNNSRSRLSKRSLAYEAFLFASWAIGALSVDFRGGVVWGSSNKKHSRADSHRSSPSEWISVSRSPDTQTVLKGWLRLSRFNPWYTRKL